MSLENVISFGNIVLADDSLREELQSKVSGKDADAAAEAAAEFATGKGYAVTADEVKEGYAILLKLQDGSSELSDTELEAVAGGKAGGGKGPSISQDFNSQVSGGGKKSGGK